ncbi:MAG: hypothetical protein IJL69_07260, partial [Oscillospiraceae bacterium]|nr:hypothetical protein [Oscillospiraceae bacterium]
MKLLLVGGDERQRRLSVLLRARGHETMCFGLDGTDRSAAAAFRAERCVLPYPCGAGTEIRAPRGCGRIGAEDVIALLP